MRVVIKALLNIFGQFLEIKFRNSRFCLNDNPSGSIWVTVAFLYSLPLIVLKSSASAIDAKQTIKITNAALISPWNFLANEQCAFQSLICSHVVACDRICTPKQAIQLALCRCFVEHTVCGAPAWHACHNTRTDSCHASKPAPACASVRLPREIRNGSLSGQISFSASIVSMTELTERTKFWYRQSDKSVQSVEKDSPSSSAVSQTCRFSEFYLLNARLELRRI